MALRLVPAETADGKKPPAKRTTKRAPAKKAAAEEKPKNKTLAEAIAGGDQLEILKAQRDEIVTSLPTEKGQAKATLHRLLTDITDRISALEKRAAVTSGKDTVVANTPNDAWDQSAI